MQESTFYLIAFRNDKQKKIFPTFPDSRAEPDLQFMGLGAQTYKANATMKWQTNYGVRLLPGWPGNSRDRKSLKSEKKLAETRTQLQLRGREKLLKKSGKVSSATT